MDTYSILWKPSAVKDIKRIDRQATHRIIRAIESLSLNPVPPGVRKMHGSDRSYRLRVGDYRVIYSLFHSHLIIEVLRVRHRKDAYRA